MSSRFCSICPDPHARSHDVDEREHAHLLVVDDSGLEIFERSPSGRPGIGHCGHADPEREAIRLKAPGAGGVGIPGQAGVDVNVNVHQSRSHVEARGVHGLRGARCCDVRRHGCDLAVLDRDIANRADPVLAVDDVAAFDQQVEIGLRAGDAGQGQGQPNSRKGHCFLFKALRCCENYIPACEHDIFSRHEPANIPGFRGLRVRAVRGGDEAHSRLPNRHQIQTSCAVRHAGPISGTRGHGPLPEVHRRGDGEGRRPHRPGR